MSGVGVAGYDALLALQEHSFAGSRVLVVGAGWMGEQYCQALAAMGINDVTVVSRSAESSLKCCEPFGFQPHSGGYEKRVPELGTFDLVIVATGLHDLQSAAELATRVGNQNVLVEKPGSLYSAELREWAARTRGLDARIRIAYNRLVYPNVWRLKELIAAEGGVTSCRYTFTELVRTINFENNRADAYERWGVANSLHVIALAHDLIGLPTELSAFRAGSLDWHPSGERFTGAGMAASTIPFSYHADWSSGGRWGVEVMTSENAYRLVPLEQLWVNKRGTFDWNLVPTRAAFPAVKAGVAEEIGVMLRAELEGEVPLVNLEQAAQYTELAERIFGYMNSAAPESQGALNSPAV